MDIYLDSHKIDNLDEVTIEDKSISFVFFGSFTLPLKHFCEVIIDNGGIICKNIFTITSVRFFELSKRMKVEVKLQIKKDK